MQMQIKSLIRCSILSILISLPTASFGTDWLQWRGPNRNGTTPESGWNPEAITEASSLSWTKDVGMGHSAVVVRGDRLYTMGNRHIRGDRYEDVVWCLSAETGEEVWTHRYACFEGEDPGPGATPALDENRLYTLSREGHLYCLDAHSGDVIWERHLINENLASIKDHWFSGSPLILENRLILNANDTGIVFDKKTGEVIWNSPSGEPGFESPVHYSVGGKDRIALKNGRHMSGIDLESGAELWNFPIGWGDCDPVVLNNKILITGGHTALLNVTTDEAELVWKNDDIQWQFQSAAVHGNHGYGFGLIDWKERRQDFYCFDIRDGNLVWSKTFEIYGAFIIAGGKLIILTGQGTLIIAETSPDGYKEIARKQVIKMQKNDTSKNYRRQCHCWTHPVLTKGKIYVRNSFGTLACVDVRE